MYKIIVCVALACLLAPAAVYAQQGLQQTFNIPDSAAATVDGLSMGCTVKSAKEKEVGNKGDFSRYSVQFYITNTTAEAKMFLYKQGWQILNDVSPYIVKFNCLNATGARLTSKNAELQMADCNVLAMVEDKDDKGKPVINKRFVKIGYWIRPGETIKTDAILIVPLNEKPNIQATIYPNMNAQIGNASYINSPGSMQPQQQDNGNTGNIPVGNFLKIQNAWKGTYINNQQGPLASTNIELDWWSAQWKLVSAMGGTYYIIKNKYTGSVISTENASLLSDNYQSNAALWMLLPVQGTNTYRIKNVANNAYLNVEKGYLSASPIWDDAESARWTLEP